MYDFYGLNLEISLPLFCIATLTGVLGQARWPKNTTEGWRHGHTSQTA
jgi:hypothetical protein